MVHESQCAILLNKTHALESTNDSLLAACGRSRGIHSLTVAVRCKVLTALNRARQQAGPNHFYHGLLGLSVARAGAVFVKKVAVKMGLGDRRHFRINGDRLQGQPRDFLDNDGVQRGLRGVGSPGKGRMAGDEHGRNLHRIEPRESPDNRESGVGFAVGADLLVGEAGGDRDRTVEIIGMRSAVAGDLAFRLRPARRGARMAVGDTADGGPRAVEDEVRGQVGGGPQLAFDNLPVEVRDDKVRRFHPVVWDTARFDRDETLLAIDAAGISPGVHDEAAADELQVGVEDLFSERFEFHALAGRTVQGYCSCPY